MTCSCDEPGTCTRCTLLSIAEAAALCEVKPGTIRQWILRGYVAGHREARRTFVIEAELLDCEQVRRHARAPATTAA